MTNIKKACRDHYEKQSLSSEQLDKLKNLQNNPQQEQQSLFAVTKNKPYRYFAAAAAIFIVVFASWTFIGYQNNLPAKVATEIAYNHSKRMELEVVTNQLVSVKTYLSELDFNLIKSDKSKQSGWELLGGRYCSIQGKLAAQLRVKQDSSSDYQTFYQAIIPDGFELPNNSYSTWVEGTFVELWIEDGVLLGLAGNAHENR